MLSLVPGVSRNVWRDNDPQVAVANADYQAKRPAALRRTQSRCQFCGVQSVTAMEVHHYDCDHANNSPENLQPACVVCHPVNHIGEIASRLSRTDKAEIAGGLVQMTYLPNISQVDLSHLMRTIGHVMSQGTPEEKEDATTLYNYLLGYSSFLESTWGTSRASHFAIALRTSSEAVYKAREVTMTGIRLIFPLKSLREMAVRFSDEFRSIPISSWKGIFQQRRPPQT